jgi:adenylyltransferase/sulfurtransferase
MSVDLTQAEILRYSRHLILPDVGLEGQRKLKNAAVLMVGTGGLGSPIGLYLAAAGVGRIGIVDYDVVDESNLQRQVMHDSASVGRLKVESARERMLAVNPFIEVTPYNEVFSAENARRIAEGYDILIDGTDNFPTRYLLNDLAALTQRPYVYGSIYRFDGQVSVFDARVGPCYRCLFPEPPPPEMVPSCAEGGVLGVLPGTVGTLQATEVLKLILGIGESLVGKLLLYDALEMSVQTIALRKNPRCKLCGPEAEIHELVDYEAFCGVPARPEPKRLAGEGIDIGPAELAERLKRGDELLLVDVRDPVEQQISALEGARSAPWERVLASLKDVDHDTEMVLFCRTGERSLRALRRLQAAGYRRVRNLAGGLNGYAEEVDPGMRKY